MTLTACKQGAYPWVPANCQEIGDEWFFMIKWEDAEGGWTGKACCGTELFHTINGKVTVTKRPKRKVKKFKIESEEISDNP